MMNYSLKLLILVLVIITTATTASAATEEIPNMRVGPQVFVCKLSYDAAMAYAGNEALKVVVFVETKGPVDVESITFESRDRDKIDFKEDGQNFSTTEETGLRIGEYKFLANIHDDIEPKNYTVTVIFKYPAQSLVRYSFPLPVGVRNKGKLTVVNGTSTPEFYVGSPNKYQIELQNNFRDYDVKIRSITVSSDPAEVVETTPVQLEDSTIGAQQQRSFPVTLNTAPISFSNLLNGFGGSSELILKVEYDDGKGRVITDLSQRVKLKMKPSGATLLMAMFIGAAIGALIKCRREKKPILKLDTLLAVGVGLVVAFIVIVAKIKIMAFDIAGGYDNPAMLAIVSCGAALGGMPIFLSIFKSSEQSSAPATTSTTSAAPKPVA